MPKYADSPGWAEVIPIPQDDGENPLAAIAYTETYSEAMSYLRAVMAANEKSERALELTETVISMNPAHYTVWLYRAQVLFALKADLRRELEWLNTVSLQHLKNYQIWQHRQVVVDRIGSSDGEIDFINEMFEKDAKNYHVWSYRQWLVQRFGLWDKGEVEAVEEMLKEDVRNNSAWNHRWYITFGRPDGDKAFQSNEIVQRELKFAEAAVRLAPQNQSPWNYIRGLQRKASGPAAIELASLRPFANEFAAVESPNDVRSSHALDLLADIYAAEEGKKQEAAKALELLADKYDPIRANYWNWRKAQLNSGVATSA